MWSLAPPVVLWDTMGPSPHQALSRPQPLLLWIRVHRCLKPRARNNSIMFAQLGRGGGSPQVLCPRCHTVLEPRVPVCLQVLVSNRPGTCHSLAGYHGIAPQHQGSRDHHLFTLLSEELMSCETVSSAGREEEEWAATKASTPSKLISIKSHCSLGKMEKRGSCESTSQAGRSEWLLYYSFHLLQPQFTSSCRSSSPRVAIISRSSLQMF